MFILITQTGPTTGSMSGQATTMGSIAQASTTQSPTVEGKNRQTINLQSSYGLIHVHENRANGNNRLGD